MSTLEAIRTLHLLSCGSNMLRSFGPSVSSTLSGKACLEAQIWGHKRPIQSIWYGFIVAEVPLLSSRVYHYNIILFDRPDVA